MKVRELFRQLTYRRGDGNPFLIASPHCGNEGEAFEKQNAIAPTMTDLFSERSLASYHHYSLLITN